LLQALARQAMLARGLLPDFSPAALAQLEAITGPAVPERDADGDLHDLRDLLWASIDNDDSEDLDQVTVAEALPGPTTRIYVAVADVDALVKKGSAIDMHAGQNTTSVYTAAEIFPMLPVRLSTDLTSLTPKGDRLAVVTEMIIGDDGALQTAQVYRALVRNHAKLAYNSVAAWLDGTGPEPDAIAAVPGLAENLRLQDRVARRMQRFRTSTAP
jgi:exoribonuclease-2